ncbi:uncharacterized protein TRIADDRAFT_23179 [Trichoplax adhaerens]|uniref:UDP-glucuronosyltransferase n=1 Tax=Trichoplax adhaerens TaxID=10228 RepID=B3RSD6_TRIAD|nr:hypothetical protein TRIADDRAFT_23179 [Trichoplax adhaerens]EDV26496.1 hypothetical protein TRIADDRAFT_23179 [Trichoplax adhaerens]|eukprot:XP_002110492.1 hypothetical protein TRIADDRAFT_23179 [Trichoplax adhaerens]
MAYYKTIDILVTDRGYLCNNLVAMAANKPHVVISPGSFNLHRGLLGNPSPLSYIPQLGSGLPSAMNFKHRLLNCLFYVIWSSTHSIYFRSTVDKVNRHYKINPSMSAEETEYTPSLLLIPADFILEFPRPVLPNVKVIGPITTQRAKPLPNDLETFLTGNTKVIYVSFGSIIESFSQEKMDILVNAFNQLPYKILWRNKFNIKNLGKHVKVLPWLPQNDILGHSNVVAFLSHCGHNGMYEAAFHGVPILGMPIQFDQFGNLQLILRADIGLGLNFNNLTSNDIINGIQNLLTNERYRKNAEYVSAILQSNPRTSREIAADWIEYVIANKGAEYLRIQAYNQSFVEYYLLDVLLVFVIVMTVLVYVFRAVIRFIYHRCCKV